ncbi:hypothetical protein E4U55_002103 [Claviceps digitariae]|nr:hypothetical protein E4U55_002103 [Claviceps digitariae]
MVRTSLVASLLAAAASTLAADSKPKAGKTLLEGAYIIELKQGHDASVFEQSLADHGKTRMKLQYDLFNGVSVQLHDLSTAKQKVAELAAMPEVVAVHPVELYPMPNPRIDWIADEAHSPEQATLVSRAVEGQDTFSPHVMTQVYKLRAKGITGQGVKVAVIDTGIDYLHPALGGCFGKDCLVSFGTDLVGDAYTGANTPQPGKNPMDCAGHGTHVAGIVAAQENIFNFTGTAPGVTLGAYRVFGCHGSAGNDVLIAAFNQAYQDGANIITSSVGEPNGWAEEPWSATVSRIVDKGVPCVISAGNEGDQGLFYASAAANGRHVAGIASYDNVVTPTLYSLSKYQIDNGPEQTFGYMPDEIANWDGVNLPLWASSLDPTVKEDACKPFPANTPDLSKYIVLIRRGTCTFDEKVKNAVAKGAKNVLIYNNVAGGAEEMGVDVKPLNAVSMIEAGTGETFIKALKDGQKVTLKMVGSAKAVKSLQVVNNTASGGAVSTYSTWGPTWEMDTKPQFGAVGGNVLSTWPRAKGSYAVLSGTSMSCPQAAGVLALIRQVRGPLDPQVMFNLLSGNANPQLFNDGTKFYDFLAPVPQQGAGLIQAYDAAYATTLLSPSSLSFNDTDHFAKNLEFTLQNTDTKPATYKVTHVPTITMYTLPKNGSIYPDLFPNDAVHAAATLHFSEASITLRGGESKNITVSAIPPEGVDAKRLALWSGYITINGTDGASLSLPYQGLTGSLHQHTVLAPSDTYISSSKDKTKPLPAPVGNNVTFVLPGPGNAGVNDTLPQLNAKLALGSPQIRVYAVPLTPDPTNQTVTTEVWGVKTIGQIKGAPSMWNSRGLNNFPWDGSLTSGSYAAPGTYKFVVGALRIFGDENKKEDWDLSTSPVLTIKYL